MESAATRALAAVASGVFGLVVGSFLNVVVYRLPRHESIVTPASHCPSCGTTLSSVDNIPVLSWLVLRGRCRHCGTSISARYPVVELLTGLLFAGVALGSSSLEPLAPLDAVIACAVAIAAIDADAELVPGKLGWISLGCSVTLVAVSLALHHPGRLIGAATGTIAPTAAWVLWKVGEGGGRRALRFPSLPACAAWGWAAGWTGAAGGLTIGIALVLLALGSSLRPSAFGRLQTAAAAVAIGAVVLGISFAS